MKKKIFALVLAFSVLTTSAVYASNTDLDLVDNPSSNIERVETIDSLLDAENTIEDVTQIDENSDLKPNPGFEINLSERSPDEINVVLYNDGRVETVNDEAAKEIAEEIKENEEKQDQVQNTSRALVLASVTKAFWDQGSQYIGLNVRVKASSGKLKGYSAELYVYDSGDSLLSWDDITIYNSSGSQQLNKQFSFWTGTNTKKVYVELSNQHVEDIYGNVGELIQYKSLTFKR
ncbi:MAG: hypothetical protein AAGU75_16785 [Bacillota bacterium]